MISVPHDIRGVSLLAYLNKNTLIIVRLIALDIVLMHTPSPIEEDNITILYFAIYLLSIVMDLILT
jgi:hypothetical protein